MGRRSQRNRTMRRPKRKVGERTKRIKALKVLMPQCMYIIL